MSVQTPVEQREPTTVGIRALARNVSGVVAEVVRSGRPTIVTRHGEPVAALVPIAGHGPEEMDEPHQRAARTPDGPVPQGRRFRLPGDGGDC